MKRSIRYQSLHVVCLVCGLSALLIPAGASAQTSGVGGTGNFGGGGTGGGGTGGGGTGGGGTGNSGQGGVGQINAGLGGIGAVDVNQAFSGGVDRTVGVGSNSGQAVGGNPNLGTPGQAGGFGGGGFGGGGFGGGGLGGLGGLFGGAFGGQAGGLPEKSAIRVRLRNAVEAPALSPVAVQQNASATINRLPSRYPAGGSINVQVSGRTATLTGVAGSDKDRRMSELLMRLEPGVSAVKNNIVVRP